MSITKEENGTYTVQCWYRDWTQDRKKKTKRGFKTKREAKAWQDSFLARSTGAPTMTMNDMFILYGEAMRPKLRLNTWLMKEQIFRTKILPYFGEKRMNEITPGDVIRWEAEIIQHVDPETGKAYSPTYQRTICNQLSAIFNHAARYYNLHENPLHKAGKIGKDRSRKMDFYTKDEYLAFSEALMDKPESYVMAEVLYWCGLRIGELLALTPNDFDFKRGTLTIDKSYQRIDGKDLITPPKTDRGYRTIAVPDFVLQEVDEYIRYCNPVDGDQRIFPRSKSYMNKEMKRGADKAGIKRIRTHDLRHSHVSLLIDMGFSALAIADRVGHEAVDITYRYAHLFPSEQTNMARAMESTMEAFYEPKIS